MREEIDNEHIIEMRTMVVVSTLSIVETLSLSIVCVLFYEWSLGLKKERNGRCLHNRDRFQTRDDLQP
jgi:hypothetical protein